MADDGSGAIHFDGLSTGLQSGEIVEQLVKVARQPIRQIERRSAVAQAHRDALDGITQSVRKLSDTVASMDRAAELKGVDAKVSDTAYLSAAVSNNAQLGSHTVGVRALAAAQLTYSDSVADADATGLLGSGSLRLTGQGGAYEDFTVDGSTTLRSLSEAIEQSSLDIRASLINEGSTTRLALQSGQSGAANGFVAQETGTTLNLADPANTPQAATDARFVLDKTSTITRPSNTINDVLEGVTLQLAAVDAGEQTLTLSASSQVAKDALQKFVENYNGVLGKIFGATKPDLSPTESKEAKAAQVARNQARLTGDSTLRSLLGGLQGALAQVIPGGAPGARSLAALGVQTGGDGLLHIDDAEINKALTASPDSIARLFARTFGSSGGPGLADKLRNLTEDAVRTGGPLRSRISGLGDTVQRLSQDVEAKERALEVYEKNLKAQFTRLEALMSKLKSQGDYLGALQSPSRS